MLSVIRPVNGIGESMEKRRGGRASSKSQACDDKPERQGMTGTVTVLDAHGLSLGNGDPAGLSGGYLSFERDLLAWNTCGARRCRG